MNRFDELWVRLRNVTAFLGGFAIMTFETIADKSDRPWLYAAAIGMMGLPIAREAEQLIGKLGSRPGPTSGIGTEKGSPEHDEK